jgi:hypothetical protein
MPYIEDKYVTLCNSCNKPIKGESISVKAKKGHIKTWLFHAMPTDCAYTEDVPVSVMETGFGGDGWIGSKSRLR